MNRIITDMDSETYHSLQGVNASTLSTYAVNPAKCILSQDESEAMAFGTAFHTLILEPENFHDDYAVIPKGMRRGTKAYKEWQEYNALEKMELTATQFYNLTAMRDSLFSGKYQTAVNIIEQSRKEVSIFWENAEHKCKCKARIDMDIPSMGLIADLKTCKDSDPSAWIASSLKYGRPHYQPAWYLDGMNALSENEYNTFLWILCEKEAPYGVSVVRATPAPIGSYDMVSIAREEIYNTVLPAYIESKKTNTWTARPDKVVDVSLPMWYVNQFNK